MLTKTVTSGPLTATTASLHLKLQDNAVTVIDKDFPESYTQAVGLTVEVRDAIRKEMQRAIDEYRVIAATKATQAYINAPGVVEGQLDLTKEL